MKLRIVTGRLSVIIVISSVCSFAPQTVGQISDEISAEDRAEIEALQERERGMAQDPSGNRPPPPDDPAETDLAKRRRFIHELNHSRINFMCFQNPDMLKEATDDIPQEKKAMFLELCSTLLAERLVPTGQESIQWYANWADYGNPDAAGNVGLTLRLIVAEWAVDGFIVRASQLVNAGRYVRIRLRFPKRQALEFHRMPADFDRHSSPWEFVSKTELRAMLVDFFDLPYTSNAAFRYFGRMRALTGADVFTANLRWPQGPGRKGDQNTNAANGSSFAGVPDRILITDSDPQYMCVSFDLQQTPQKERAEP